MESLGVPQGRLGGRHKVLETHLVGSININTHKAAIHLVWSGHGLFLLLVCSVLFCSVQVRAGIAANNPPVNPWVREHQKSPESAAVRCFVEGLPPLAPFALLIALLRTASAYWCERT